jgi:hypothetical protein
VQAPFEPASAAALPSVVSAADVPRANSLIAATSSAGYLVGPLLGGAVVAVGASPVAARLLHLPAARVRAGAFAASAAGLALAGAAPVLVLVLAGMAVAGAGAAALATSPR